jgi:hypothetical protein
MDVPPKTKMIEKPYELKSNKTLLTKFNAIKLITKTPIKYTVHYIKSYKHALNSRIKLYKVIYVCMSAI